MTSFDFDGAEELSQLSEQPSVSIPSSVCIVCGALRCSNRVRFCRVHQGTFKAMERQQTTQEKKEGFKNTMGTDVSAALAITKYNAEHPSPGVGKRRTGKFKAIQYWTSFQCASYKDVHMVYESMDLKRLAVHMEIHRKWTWKESEVYWCRLKKDPAVKRDMMGLEKSYELQLDIPIGLRTQIGQRTEEQHCLSVIGKRVRSATPSQMKAMLAEIQKGHQRNMFQESQAAFKLMEALGCTMYDSELAPDAITKLEIPGMSNPSGSPVASSPEKMLVADTPDDGASAVSREEPLQGEQNESPELNQIEKDLQGYISRNHVLMKRQVQSDTKMLTASLRKLYDIIVHDCVNSQEDTLAFSNVVQRKAVIEYIIGEQRAQEVKDAVLKESEKKSLYEERLRATRSSPTPKDDTKGVKVKNNDGSKEGPKEIDANGREAQTCLARGLGTVQVQEQRSKSDGTQP